MANYANLLATIAANIYQNGNNEVTAPMVKTAVDAMVASLGAGYQFMGVATPATTPSNTDVKQFYIASTPGTYTNFLDAGSNPLVVNDGELAVLKYATAWEKESIGFGSVPYTTLTFPNRGFLEVDGTFDARPALSWWTTDFISVYPGVAYGALLYGNVGAVCSIAFYTAEKEFISADSIFPSATGFADYSGVVPVGAYYLRACTYDLDMDTSFLHIWGPNQFEGGAAYSQKYHDNLQRPYEFSGKKITFFGDSITKGVASDGGTLVTITDCYAKLLCDKLGATLDNRGVSASRFVGPGGGTPPTPSITSEILSFIGTTDVIWIAGGTNDYQLQSPIGDDSDTTEVSMYGALYLVCEYLKTNYPTATIIFATPINWSREVSNPIPIERYRDVIFEMATKYGYSVVDCSEIGFPAEQTAAGTPAYKAAMIYDGVHPTTLGHEVMANNLASKVL